MGNHKLTMLLLAGLMLAVVPAVQAQEQSSMYYKWWQSPEVIVQLELTHQETQSLETLNLELRRKIIDLRNQIQQARVSLDSYFDQDPLDEHAISQQYAALAQAQAEIAMEKSRFLLEARKVLGRDRFIELRNLFATGKTSRGLASPEADHRAIGNADAAPRSLGSPEAEPQGIVNPEAEPRTIVNPEPDQLKSNNGVQ